MRFYPLMKFSSKLLLLKGWFLEGKRSGTIHNVTMDVSSENKSIEEFSGGVQWYMMESKDFIVYFKKFWSKKTKMEVWYHSTDNQ